MLKTNFIRLTKIQQEVLELLFDGNLMTIDRMNLASIADRAVAPNTRYYLTENKLVTRKDKTKSINTKNNGYIISEKGLKTLNENRNIKRRGTPRVLLEKKRCGKCSSVKPISSFVSVFGFKNPRGKYCFDCFLEIQQEHVISLMEGRDFCLYCGERIRKAYDWSEDGKSAKTYVNRDHMDPISLGGRDDNRNTVYCCRSCNIKKGNKSFIEWLKLLKPKNSELAREVYIKKHKHNPEKFKPLPTKLEITIG
jgi:5-methylcytosine-specific restriction endonuclease McrA